MKKLTLLSFLLICFLSAQAQTPDKEFGIKAGFVTYSGDLVAEDFSTEGLGPFIGVVYRKKFFERVSAYGELSFASFKGDDTNFEGDNNNRGFSFETSTINASVGVDLRLLTGNFTPYVTAGIGAALINNDRETGRVPLDKDDEDFDNLTAFIPVGGGVRIQLSEKMSLGLEATARFFPTDFLDGFSNSANATNKDFLFTGLVNLNFALGGDKE